MAEQMFYSATPMDGRTAEERAESAATVLAALNYFHPADGSSDTNRVPPVDTNKKDPDFLVNEEKSVNAVDAIENSMHQENAAYITDLGYTLDLNKKLTLRDLGQHMTDRMLEAMSQEKINQDFSNFALGSPMSMHSSVNENPVINIFKSLFSNQGSDGAKPDFVSYDDTSDNSTAADELQEMMRSRYGDYVSDLKNYREYVKNCKGLAMGEANVVNPPFMFNELDDVRSDFRRPFLGRTFSEEIYDYNMPIVYFQPGIVNIDTAGIKFMSGLINKKTEAYQNYLRGDGGALKWAASKVGAGVNAMLSLGGKSILDKAQWFKWTPTISKYLHFVNDLILELATWMGLIGGNYDGDINSKDKIFNQAFKEAMDKMISEDSKSDGYDSMDKAFDDNTANNVLADDKYEETTTDNIDISTVESKSGYMGGDGTSKSVLSVHRCLPLFKKPETGSSSGFSDSDEESSVSLTRLVEVAIPFAMDKGAQSSETFSNSTQQHPLVEQYNQMYEESNANTMKGIGVNGAQDVLANGLDTMNNVLGFGLQKGKDFANNQFAKLGLSSEAGMVAGGLGRFMLPEIWSDSTFDKSYSISIKLRSPYGHRLSIFENEFVPLAFLIGMTAARKIGLQSYTNPFYVKMFAKGLFSVPMGMITSLSISRGEDSNDRTVEGFFRTTNVNISVKDMLPTMCVGVGGGEMSIMNASNLGMNNYIFTLCGIDFVERANYLTMLKNKFNKLSNFVMSHDPTGLIGDGATGRSNLLFQISNSFVGRNISRAIKAVGKSENPYHKSSPNKFY